LVTQDFVGAEIDDRERALWIYPRAIACDSARRQEIKILNQPPIRRHVWHASYGGLRGQRLAAAAGRQRKGRRVRHPDLNAPGAELRLGGDIADSRVDREAGILARLPAQRHFVTLRNGGGVGEELFDFQWKLASQYAWHTVSPYEVDLVGRESALPQGDFVDQARNPKPGRRSEDPANGRVVHVERPRGLGRNRQPIGHA